MTSIKTKHLFEKELETILFIYLDAKYYFLDYKYLCNPDTEDERIASNISIIQRITKAFWRLTVIELAKLFQKSKLQHYNLVDYISNLELNYDKYNWINDLPRKKLKDWTLRFKSHEIQKIIEKLKIQRDQYFAHTDKNPIKPIKETIISFNEVEKLITLTGEIIFSLKEYCLKEYQELDVSGMEKAGNILAIISLGLKKRNQDLIADFNKEMRKRKK